MTEDYIITIEGTIVQDDEPQTLSLTTRGSFTTRGDHHFINYHETEATGFEGCMTTLKVATDGKRVTMLRFGNAPSQLIIEQNSRHVCHYETGQGALSLGVSTKEIRNELRKDEGGFLKFSYALDVNATALSQNTVEVTVRRAE